MSTAKRAHVRRTIGAVATLIALSNAGASERPVFTRSLYIPIALIPCSHLEHAVLYENELPVGFLPASRIFQFTYYSDLRRTEPSAIQLRVQAKDVDTSEPFDRKITVTHEGVYTAREHVDFHFQKELQKLRYKLDVRAPRVYLKLQCEKESAEAHAEPTGQNE
jgi:hypothetical protein